MTLQIKKSALWPTFEEDLAAHIEALHKHRFTKNVAAPTADPIIEGCVQRIQYPIKAKKPDEFYADYEIIDDTPVAPPPLTLRERKDKLLDLLGRQQIKMIEDVLPPGKRILREVRQSMIHKKPSVDWTDAEQAYIEEGIRLVEDVDKIRLTVAESMSDVEDLTDETVGAYEERFST